MRIAPMKSRKKEKFSLKKIFPYLLIVLMLGSVFVAFTYSAGTAEIVNLAVVNWNDFRGDYDVIVSNQYQYQDNLTATNLLRMSGVNVQIENDTIQCISAFCNFDRTWKFYVNNELQIISPDYYIVNQNDYIAFVYE